MLGQDKNAWEVRGYFHAWIEGICHLPHAADDFQTTVRILRVEIENLRPSIFTQHEILYWDPVAIDRIPVQDRIGLLAERHGGIRRAINSYQSTV